MRNEGVLKKVWYGFCENAWFPWQSIADLRMEVCLQKYSYLSCYFMGAQWLSGRVLNSRPKGHGFEPQRRHCVLVLEQDTFILA